MIKNVQVVDGTFNTALSIYELEDEYFDILFPDEADVAFLSDFPVLKADLSFLKQFNKRPVDKKTVQGIHGTLHLASSPADKRFFPTRRESDHRRYAVYFEYHQHWVGDYTVQCAIQMDGKNIATVVVDLVKDAATIIEGGFSKLPHSEISLLGLGTTHGESMLEGVKASTRRWADNNR